MSDWTHAICDDCWDDRRPDTPAPRMTAGEIEHCCYCGRHTASGIYVRDDPASIADHDEHHRGAVVDHLAKAMSSA